jgi:hypothetical protein
MRKLLVVTCIFLLATALVFSGCDAVKGLFGGKAQTGPGQPPAVTPPGGSATMTPEMTAASVNGKYYNLLIMLNVPQDQGGYGNFYDWGYYTGTSYAGYNNIPPGYWVYVYPNWYIWGNTR